MAGRVTTISQKRKKGGITMIVKDLIQMLSDFDENMEVGIKSTCGMLDIVTSVERRRASIFDNQDIVCIKGIWPSEYNKKL